MRILIYGLNYAPELTGIGKYTGDMAAWLARRGHQVRVVAAPPYYPAWKVREDYRGKPYRVEHEAEGLTVFRAPLWVPDRPGGLKRMLHLASFLAGSVPALLRQLSWSPDVVFTVEPTFFCAPAALAVARLTDAKSWLHVQDFEVDAAFDLGLLPAEGFLHDAALWLEESFTDAFDRVSSISSKMVQRSLAKGVAPERAVLFPNWVDVDAVVPGDRMTVLRRELGLGEKVVFLYSGNMGAKQGLELLAPLAQTFANDENTHFLFCGDGVFRPQLESLVRESRNVTLLPLQPLERLNELLNTADVHLLPQRSGAADLVMPSKLTGMLSSGRPVLATADQGTQVAETVLGRGLVVPPEDSAALEAAARTLVIDAQMRESMGRAAREYAVQHLGREQVLLQFERDIKALLRP